MVDKRKWYAYKLDGKAEVFWCTNYRLFINTCIVHQIFVLSNENINTGVSREMIFKNSFHKIHFGILIHVLSWKTFILDIFKITDQKQRNKNQQIFDEQLM